MVKIYFACSLTQAPEEFKLAIEDIKKLLRPKYDIMEFLGLVLGTPEEVYRHDTECVKNCDLLVADCTYPAIGLGMEISLALQLNKPILALAHKDAKVSRMVLGIQANKFTFARYETAEEMENFISKKIADESLR